MTIRRRKPGSGRRPGYKHSEQTKEKIRQSLLGKIHSEERRSNISAARSFYELDEKCLARFEELKSDYPDQESFFLDNRDELLFAMRDVRTEKELSDFRKYIETTVLRADEPYQYSSSSFYAAEDNMIALLDFKRLLQTYH
jgi:hypothetical protein